MVTLSGTIEIDGSSTVFPVSEAVAEEFGKLHRDVRVNVGVSGTGGGFKRFTAGETDISDASRPIKDREAAAAKENGVEYIELKVGTDGLSVTVSPENGFVDCLTVAELKRIWEPGSKITRWNQVRPEFPDRPMRLYGADTDSGTFDYFTEEIVGEAQASRADYTASADDNVLVQGISGDRNALGYFGYAYYAENPDKLKVVAVRQRQRVRDPHRRDDRERRLRPSVEAAVHLREHQEPAAARGEGIRRVLHGAGPRARAGGRIRAAFR